MTADKSHKAGILKWLQTGRSITPFDALDKYGCFRLAAVIFELRHKDNYNISMKRVKPKNYGEYTLHEN